ncbi:DUF4079 domain-containing protein [Lusitaniella coriacea LEGE 07157]|uniref:DUF4079 domain-containing protein n=1 Tax=Lusitaniella coriacea LEGE 07157 TaxID=945747 RepID=A0A8J7DV22_9CYAN|nr:DUF4079 domain-containing protein [Lusitaniella coriacea]MBE9115531.1 DUF4079 domain-containing protein [Lusitaniella coriacea LEGE 07157]
MNATQWAGIIHPAIAIIFVFPLIGIVVNFAWQTRQRRLQIAPQGGKSKIPPVVGREHVSIGRWLAGAVVGVWFLGTGYAITTKGFIQGNLLETYRSQAIFILLMGVATIASFALLYRARERLWRTIFAVLSSGGLLILSFTDKLGIIDKSLIFRRDNQWYFSHFYYGTIATILMIISLAIIQEIYQDRSNRWRNLHIILNCIALLLFVGQGITGARDLFEIGLYASP